MLAGLFASGALMAGGNLVTRDLNDASAHFQTTWQNTQLPVRWHLSSNGFPGSGYSNAQLQGILQTAFDTWQQVPSSTISFQYAGEADESAVGVDGINLVTFTDPDYVFPSGVLAMAVNHVFTVETTIDDTNNDLDGDGIGDLPNGTYPAGSIYETDIVFNSSYVFENTGADSSTDLQAVALHEIGHLFGLAHSIIPGAVMHPFLSQSIASARVLKADDVAYISYLYPAEPAFSSSFGSISGTVTNGLNGQRILGAHVYAFDPLNVQKVVGAYSLGRGDYLIPGLPPGNYYVGIEPLDGDPREADPARINALIENTFDTRFDEEFYDDNESSIETDAANADSVTVAAGADSAGIDLVTNTVEVPGVSLLLRQGLNLFAYPVETAEGFMSFDLLTAIGDETEINSIDFYDSATGRYRRSAWVDGAPAGENFAIERGVGYVVHMQQQKSVTFRGRQNCPAVDVGQGFNLVGVACPPAEYSAFDLLESFPTAVRVMRYNVDSASLETADYDGDELPQGVDFPIRNGEAYVVETEAADGAILLPGPGQLFPPSISGLSPGQAIVGSTVLIMGQGFAEDAVANEVSFNGARAAVSFSSGDSLVVAVPSGATSGPVTVSVNGLASNAVDFIVEPFIISEEEAAGRDLASGQVVEGSLGVDGEQDRYTFVASKGALVTLGAQAVNPGVPDLILALEGPFGTILTSDDNSGSGNNPLISRFELPLTGRYTAVVTQAPGSGTGPYTFSIDIENFSTLPEINLLGGDFQTGLMGTEFAEPLEILVTGSTGAPVAGATITLVTDDALQVSSGFTAASTQVKTGGNGIALVTMTAPDALGEYDITIQVPGMEAKTFQVGVVQRLPAFVEKSGDAQTCGDDGCPVDELLPETYRLRFLDSQSQPLENVLAKFIVASGEGKIQGAGGTGERSEIMRSSDANGVVEVTHKLGKVLLDENTRKPIPQVVAAVASIPNSPGAILFQPQVRAGDPAKLEFLSGGFEQMTIFTAVTNAVIIEVKDEFDNPVADADVNMSAAGDIKTFPGLLNGEFLPDFKTNEYGQFVGMLVADETPPTIDEFGGRTGNSAYNVSVSVSGAGSKSFQVEVDMGPSLLSDVLYGGAPPGYAAWVGEDMDMPVQMSLVSFHRQDSCSGSDGVDSDQGEWTDEPFDVENMSEQGFNDVNISFKAFRFDDGETDGNSVSPTSAPTGNFGLVSTTLTMGEARGGVIVEARHGQATRNLKTSATCWGDPEIRITGDPEDVDPAVKIKANFIFAEFLAASPRIEVTLSEVDPGSPDPDPIPSKTPYSGLNLEGLTVKLNNETLFDGADPGSVEQGRYPNFVEMYFDGLSFGTIDSDTIGPLSPGEFRFVYYPTKSQLEQGQNTVEVKGLEDKVGNFENGGTGEMLKTESFNFP